MRRFFSGRLRTIVFCTLSTEVWVPARILGGESADAQLLAGHGLQRCVFSASARIDARVSRGKERTAEPRTPRPMVVPVNRDRWLRVLSNTPRRGERGRHAGRLP